MERKIGGKEGRTNILDQKGLEKALERGSISLINEDQKRLSQRAVANYVLQKRDHLKSLPG